MKNEKYKLLISCIPEGLDKAISQNKLSKLLGVDKRVLRAHIQDARRDGIPICSIPGEVGYFFSDNPEEILRSYNMFLQRNKSNWETLKALQKHLEEVVGGEENVR